MKTIPFSIRFSEKIHDLVQNIAKSTQKTPTDVIESALSYPRLDFRMRHIDLQKNKNNTLQNLISKQTKIFL